MITIQYALTRSEIARSYFRSLRNSSRFLLTVLLYAALASGLMMLSTGAFSHGLTGISVLETIVGALLFILLLPGWLYLRGKTAMRSLTVSPEGISTQIGSIQAEIPWRKVKIIAAANNYVLISRASGNSFYIPDRAFSDPNHKADFVSAIQQWASGTVSSDDY